MKHKQWKIHLMVNNSIYHFKLRPSIEKLSLSLLQVLLLEYQLYLIQIVDFLVLTKFWACLLIFAHPLALYSVSNSIFTTITLWPQHPIVSLVLALYSVSKSLSSALTGWSQHKALPSSSNRMSLNMSEGLSVFQNPSEENVSEWPRGKSLLSINQV